MKRITQVARLLLGLVFVLFSTNYFVPFLPQPAPPPPAAMAFAGALVVSGMMTLVKVIELAAGIALLANRAVPLALTLLAPITVGIVFFHVALAPAGTGMALGLVALEVLLAWSYRSVFRPLLTLRVSPDAARDREAARVVTVTA